MLGEFSPYCIGVPPRSIPFNKIRALLLLDTHISFEQLMQASGLFLIYPCCPEHRHSLYTSLARMALNIKKLTKWLT
jgi:hypothetical protein